MGLAISVVTLFPEMFTAVSEYGITGKAVSAGLLQISTVNPRDYATDRHRTVDDRPYGGGPGMVMTAQPLLAAIRDARQAMPGAAVSYLSPQGQRLGQQAVTDFAGRDSFILVAGRYEGVDERVIELEVDEEWSIGDYVLSGGELPAMVLIDAVARCLPGALGNDESATEDSFFRGMLDCPHYTRPEVVAGLQAPPVLLSGDHDGIRKWRLKQALGRTWKRRPDLLEALVMDAEKRALLDEYITEQRNDE
ncbi:MAG: tRNA (guanosine(37)-N1)-methyltransferase TrmD [Gammaproteobacteria bacterium]|nr:tRNA (guanosine(37)-N1)-methyltransferase TrmD [Gammaproteobacteria bacterium]